MTPAVPPDANVVYRAPDDWDEAVNGKCLDISVIKKDGVIHSIWKPDEKELLFLNSGGYVLVAIVADDLPPISVGAVMTGFAFPEGLQMAATEKEDGPGT